MSDEVLGRQAVLTDSSPERLLVKKLLAQLAAYMGNGSLLGGQKCHLADPISDEVCLSVLFEGGISVNAISV